MCFWTLRGAYISYNTDDDMRQLRLKPCPLVCQDCTRPYYITPSISIRIVNYSIMSSGWIFFWLQVFSQSLWIRGKARLCPSRQNRLFMRTYRLSLLCSLPADRLQISIINYSKQPHMSCNLYKETNRTPKRHITLAGLSCITWLRWLTLLFIDVPV